jgi:phospholipase C
MSDNSWDTVFGPSSPGALNLISGQTHGAQAFDPTTDQPTASSSIADPDANGVGTLPGDADPVYDDCSDNDHTATSPVIGMQGKNIGDLLNAKNVTWGWFQGGFKPSTPWDGNSADYAKCDSTTTNVAGAAPKDYSPHHNPFEYYKSTSNPHHLPPTSEAMIGKTDQANHEYDLSDFNTSVQDGNMPAVSFLKAPEAQDGHASYSDPIDEQKFLVNEINTIESSSEWSSTAIVIAYDDSDGWYDHVAPTILNGSKGSADTTTLCTGSSAPAAASGYQDRCGPSQRLPMIVISPYSKTNYIDHTAVEQTSILKFIEQNWYTGSIGDGSFDQRAGSIDGMFNFSAPKANTVMLNADGSVASVTPPPPPPVDFSVSTSFSAATVTAGHKVTVTGSATNHGTATERIALSGSFTFMGRGHSYTLKLPSSTVSVRAGATSTVHLPITVTKLLPKGSYKATLTGTDPTGTQTSSSTITVK